MEQLYYRVAGLAKSANVSKVTLYGPELSLIYTTNYVYNTGYVYAAVINISQKMLQVVQY